MQDKIKIAGIVEESIVDGPGIRFVIFTQGCPHKCKGCHNPQTHDFSLGRYEDIDKLVDMIDENPLLSGITLSGGEPFLQPLVLANLIDKIKNKNLDVITYTGYKYEELVQSQNKDILELLKRTDVLIDGKFVLELKDENLEFRGSSNQRAIYVKKSMKKGSIIEYNF